MCIFLWYCLFNGIVFPNRFDAIRSSSTFCLFVFAINLLLLFVLRQFTNVALARNVLPKCLFIHLTANINKRHKDFFSNTTHIMLLWWWILKLSKQWLGEEFLSLSCCCCRYCCTNWMNPLRKCSKETNFWRQYYVTASYFILSFYDFSRNLPAPLWARYVENEFRVPYGSSNSITFMNVMLLMVIAINSFIIQSLIVASDR